MNLLSEAIKMSRNPTTVNKEIDDIVKKMAEMRKIQTKHHKEDSIWLEIFGPEEIQAVTENTISINTSIERYYSPDYEEGKEVILPSAGDTIFFFLKPELLCGGKYEVQDVTAADQDIEFVVKLIEAFSNPISLGTLLSNSQMPPVLQEQLKVQLEENFMRVKEED
jgi:hypothetical protein